MTYRANVRYGRVYGRMLRRWMRMHYIGNGKVRIDKSVQPEWIAENVRLIKIRQLNDSPDVPSPKLTGSTIRIYGTYARFYTSNNRS